jgi:hypothetical protein
MRERTSRAQARVMETLKIWEGNLENTGRK